jgi:hypothetical protein
MILYTCKECEVKILRKVMTVPNSFVRIDLLNMSYTIDKTKHNTYIYLSVMNMH